MQFHTNVRNAMLDAIETIVGTSPYVQLFSGTMPADCNTNIGTWAVSTAYALGAYVLANGNVYKCSQAGTSASSGTGPATTGTAITDNTAKWDFQGVKLGEGQSPSDWAGNAANGAKSKSGSTNITGLANGYAAWFAITDSGKTFRGVQGLCGQNWAASTLYALTEQVINGGLVYKCTTAGISAASGGPTTTGTGIADGAAVWSYVGVADATLDNDNINAGQVGTLSTLTFTAGNA
jgi:hypothetical protein